MTTPLENQLRARIAELERMLGTRNKLITSYKALEQALQVENEQLRNERDALRAENERLRKIYDATLALLLSDKTNDWSGEWMIDQELMERLSKVAAEVATDDEILRGLPHRREL